MTDQEAIAIIKTSAFFRSVPSICDLVNGKPYEGFYKGLPFNRLGLTLSVKGWTSSVQWSGTIGARGTGKTIAEAITNSIKFAEEKWSGRVEKA
jgi:hypothetical protein